MLVIPKAVNDLRTFYPATDSTETSGYEVDCDISNAGCCEVLSVFLRSANLHNSWQNISSRNSVHKRARDRLFGCQSDYSNADPLNGATR